MKRTRLIQTEALPDPERFGPGAVLVYDRRLTRRLEGFTPWSRRFPARYPVRAGEELKAVDAFPEHIRKLVERTGGFGRSESVLVCAGGGSVGDFGGFAASVLRRGVGLVHVPSTWLSAIDSAHGGKTALNVAGAKNQIGTFYPADAVHLVKNLLFSQPRARAEEALSEFVKVALIDGGPWAKRVLTSPLLGADLVWTHLKSAIQAKMRVVEADPEETGGHRQILNFGHTLGHVLEAHHGLAHGTAVAQGQFFALDWSRSKVRLSEDDHAAFHALLARHTGQEPGPGRLPKIPNRTFLTLLGRDKKSDALTGVTFVFLKGLGRPIRRRVSHQEVAEQAAAHGWI
jgi:3-dehydroquinate synthase